MSPQAAAGGFRLVPVADGAAQQIELRHSVLDYDASETLKEGMGNVLRDLLEEGHRTFLLDLEPVTLVDSCGVGMLISMHHQVVAEGGQLFITGACPFVVKVLRMMRLDKYLNLCDSREKALRSVTELI